MWWRNVAGGMSRGPATPSRKASRPATASTLRRRGQPVLQSSRSAPRWDTFSAFSIDSSRSPAQSSPTASPEKRLAAEKADEQEAVPATIKVSHEPILSAESQKYAHADRGSSRQPVTQALMDEIERLSREEYSAAPMPSRLAAARSASSAMLLALKSSGERPNSAAARVPQQHLKASHRAVLTHTNVANCAHGCSASKARGSAATPLSPPFSPSFASLPRRPSGRRRARRRATRRYLTSSPRSSGTTPTGRCSRASRATSRRSA